MLAGTSKSTYGIVKENKAILNPLPFSGMPKDFSKPWILAIPRFDRSMNETKKSRQRIGSTARSSFKSNRFSEIVSARSIEMSEA